MAGRLIPPLTDDQIGRFWSKVDRSAGLDACWPWTACRTAAGYGRYSVGRNHVENAHRVAYFLVYGKQPITTHHRCRFKPCCNPSHLESVTDREHGERHRWSICGNGHSLTPDNVYVINDRSKGYPIMRCSTCRRESRARYRAAHPHNPRSHDCRGKRNGNAKLTDDDVRAIRRRAAAGEQRAVIADSLGVSKATVCLVVKRKRWGHIA